MKNLKKFNEGWREDFADVRDRAKSLLTKKDPKQKEQDFIEIIETLNADGYELRENVENSFTYDVGSSIRREYHPGYEVRIDASISDYEGGKDKITISFVDKKLQDDFGTVIEINSPFTKSKDSIKSKIALALEECKEYFQKKVSKLKR